MRAINKGLASLAVGTLAVGLISVAGAGTANAAATDVLGGLYLEAPTGNIDNGALELHTDGACPAGTRVRASLYDVGADGSETPATQANDVALSPGMLAVTPTGGTSPSSHGGFFSPISGGGDLKSVLAANSVSVVPPNGQYEVRLFCQNTTGTVTDGHFKAFVNFTANSAAVRDWNYSATAWAPPAAPTTTTLTQSAPSSTSGDPVTFTADTTDGVAGSIQFKDGAANIGSAVAVDALGGAAVTTSTLTVGSHNVTAVFTPSVTTHAGSTSPSVTHVVNGAPAQNTTTDVVATPGTGAAFSAQTLTATVAPAAAAGSVAFSSNIAGNLGSVPVSGGTAALSTSALGTGAHTITATFTPANPAAYNGSTGTTTVTLTAPAYAPDEQTITAEIPLGTLIITTPYTPESPLNVGTLALDTTNFDKFLGSATFNNIQVSDTRAGALPWTLSAIAGALTKGTDSINGQNVGLTNLLQDSATPGMGTVTATDNPVPAVPVAPGAAGNAGLGGAPHTVLSAVNGPGTVVYHGTLTVTAPTSTPAGVYTGVITFTVA